MSTFLCADILNSSGNIPRLPFCNVQMPDGMPHISSGLQLTLQNISSNDKGGGGAGGVILGSHPCKTRPCTHPTLQAPKALAPLTQAAAALGKGAAGVLHAPQWAGSVLRFASQPLLASPSQFSNLRQNGKMRRVSCLST
jgi:hypothetical protein